MPSQIDTRPVTACTAHAGALNTVPNTKESVLAGLACVGGGVIEVDVRFSPDGAPILTHDAAPDESAFLLEDCFALARDYDARINLDLKEADGNVPEIRRLAEQYGMLDRVFFTGIRAKDVPCVCEYGVPYYLNVYPGALMARLPGATRRLARKAKALGAVGLNLPYRWTTPALVKAARAEALEVSAWTVDKPADMRRLLALGVDNITTKQPETLIQLIVDS